MNVAKNLDELIGGLLPTFARRSLCDAPFTALDRFREEQAERAAALDLRISRRLRELAAEGFTAGRGWLCRRPLRPIVRPLSSR